MTEKSKSVCTAHHTSLPCDVPVPHQHNSQFLATPYNMCDAGTIFYMILLCAAANSITQLAFLESQVLDNDECVAGTYHSCQCPNTARILGHFPKRCACRRSGTPRSACLHRCTSPASLSRRDVHPRHHRFQRWCDSGADRNTSSAVGPVSRPRP